MRAWFRERYSLLGHWNSEGHRIAGEELAQAICLQLSKRNSAADHSGTSQEIVSSQTALAWAKSLSR